MHSCIAEPFGPEELNVVLALVSQPTPSHEELAAALAELYPAPGGPTVEDILAKGWLIPSVDKKRLRLPPPTQRELTERLTQIPRMPPADKARPLFSYYNGPITNTRPHTNALTLSELHRLITAPPLALQQQAEAALTEYTVNGKTARYKELKNGLDYFTVGGQFSRRADQAVLEESGLLVLDFDGLGEQLVEARNALLQDVALAPALGLLFVSPSGDGLKAVLAADPRHSRRTNYDKLNYYLSNKYGWGPTLDRSTADLSRACFMSHDPSAWLAPSYA